MNKYCKRAIHKNTMPGIVFDEKGDCNYCKIYDELAFKNPRGTIGTKKWTELIKKIKRQNINKKYDCIVGVSGGTDSCWMLHLSAELGLKVLAVNLDNGFHSNIAVENIKKVVSKLGFDLKTYVINYNEIKDLLLCYMKAGLPWIDAPTDLAIHSSLYKIASQVGVKYVFIGNDFRSEGTQPLDWSHSDGKQLKFLHKKFGNVKLKTYPNLTMWNMVYFSFVKKIKMIRPFYYVDYNKQNAKKILEKNYSWKDYGGHHHENIFTRFTMSNWLVNKFDIDKRIITLSAQVLSGHISRKNALVQISNSPLKSSQLVEDQKYIIKKLGISEKEFNKIWNVPNKFYYDYPSYLPMIERFIKIISFLFKYLVPWRPMMLNLIEMKNKKK